jgi:hypothetical protein
MSRARFYASGVEFGSLVDVFAVAAVTTTTEHQSQEINSADAWRRKLQAMQLILAGAATIAMFALFHNAPGDAQTAAASGPVHLIDQTTDAAPPPPPAGCAPPDVGIKIGGDPLPPCDDAAP